MELCQKWRSLLVPLPLLLHLLDWALAADEDSPRHMSYAEDLVPSAPSVTAVAASAKMTDAWSRRNTTPSPCTVYTLDSE